MADDGERVIEHEAGGLRSVAFVPAVCLAYCDAELSPAVAVVHRHGVVPIGEAAVAIVTAAKHRGEAYEANRFVIEAIKERLPIWKRERFADGSEWKRPGA